MTNRGAATTLIGRATEIDTLRGVFRAAGAGAGQVVIVEGEAGIGKTRLVQEALRDAREQGFQVLAGACDDLERTRPFAAMTQALAISTGSPDADRGAIAELLSREDSGPSAHSASPTPGVQFRVVEELGAVVERIAAGGPLVLVLEDLHWADTSTLIALRSIARRVEQLPVVLLGTCRPGHGAGDLHRVIDDLLRAGATCLPLGPLDEEAIEALVAELLGGDDPSAALLQRLKGATGNPLFVTEYVHSVSDEGAGVPLEFRLSVLRRLGHLSEATNSIVRLASVLGSTFSPSDLSIVLDKPSVELTSSLQEALDAGVIGERGDRLAFRHDLVRDAVYEHMPLAVRRQLHGEVGRSLAAAGVRPLVVAHHMSLGAESVDPETADWLRRAAREVAARAPAVAVEFLERARELLPRSSPDRDAVLGDLVMALAWSGRLADAEALGLEVLEGHPSPEVAGAIRCGLVYALTWQGRAKEALRHAETGPSENLSESDSILLKAEAAVASLLSFDLREAGVRAAEAAELAEAAGHELALCHALSAQVWVSLLDAGAERALELSRRAIDIADRSESGEPHLAHPRFFPAIPLIGLDRLDEAEEVLQTGRRIAEEMGLVWSLPLYHAFLVCKRFVAGDWDGAIAESDAALAIADEVGLYMSAITATSAWRAAIQVHRDDLEGAEKTLADAERRAGATGPPVGLGLHFWAKAFALEARGNVDGALTILQPAWDAFFAAGAKGTDAWTQMALVRLLVQTGNRERAAPLLRSIEESLGGATPFLRGQALRCRGLVEGDPETLLKAVAEYRQCPRPLDLAAGCEDAGVHLARASRLDEAVPVLDEATQIYDDLGAVRDVRRVRAELRRLGVARGTGRRRERATSGWESLTQTELKVVALVAQRLSNPEVAERLFISRHTVESHLKHVYQKLSLRSRVELAAEAARHPALTG